MSHNYQSNHYGDGYNDALYGRLPSPPDSVYRTLEDGSREYSNVGWQEYMAGYNDYAKSRPDMQFIEGIGFVQTKTAPAD